MQQADYVLNGKISLDDSQSMYMQLVNIIKSGIKLGELKQGDLLPSEADLVERYSVSRTTVRLAFAQLEKEELVVRRRGKGTFISIPKIKRSIDNLYSFSNEMKALGKVPESKMLEFEIVEADHYLTGVFTLNLGCRLYKIVRIRLADGEPQLIETTYIPYEICDFLTSEMLEKGSLYDILYNRANVQLYSAKESYEPVVLRKREAKLLGCKAGGSAFFIQRRSILPSGAVFEFTQSYLRGDRTRLEITLFKGSVELSRSFDRTEK